MDGPPPRKNLNRRRESARHLQKKRAEYSGPLYCLDIFPKCIFPRYFLTISELCSSSCLVSQALYLVVRSLNASRLPANDLRDIFRQIASDRLLVAFLCTILSGLHQIA